MKKPYKKGDMIKTWFSGNSDGMSTVIKVYNYRGRYNFTWVIRATAAKTCRGWMEFCI